jgi:hypothetical protein
MRDKYDGVPPDQIPELERLCAELRDFMRSLPKRPGPFPPYKGPSGCDPLPPVYASSHSQRVPLTAREQKALDLYHQPGKLKDIAEENGFDCGNSISSAVSIARSKGVAVAPRLRWDKPGALH